MPRATPFTAADVASRANHPRRLRLLSPDALAELAREVGVPEERISAFAQEFLAVRDLHRSHSVTDEDETPARVAASFDQIVRRLNAFANSLENSPQWTSLKTALIEAPMSVRQAAFFKPGEPAGLPRKIDDEIGQVLRVMGSDTAEFLRWTASASNQERGGVFDKLDELVGKLGESAGRTVAPSSVAEIDEATILRLPELLHGAAKIAKAAADSYNRRKAGAHQPTPPGKRRERLAHDLQRLAIHHGCWAELTPAAKAAWLRRALSACVVQAPKDERKFAALMLPQTAWPERYKQVDNLDT